MIIWAFALATGCASQEEAKSEASDYVDRVDYEHNDKEPDPESEALPASSNGDNGFDIEEHWPEVPGPYRELAEKSRKEYLEKGYRFEYYLPEASYNPFGDYMNWGTLKNYEKVPQDISGIVLVNYNGILRYNPCTIAQQALSLYGKYLKQECSKWGFLHVANFVIDMMEDDGSLRYYFDFPYYCMPEQYFKTGWVSGMDTGHVLSICARAYNLTGYERYEVAAEKALDFLKIPISQDGVRTTLSDLDPSLQSYSILEEYPTSPATYTLNGYMYTLLGLYDWSSVNSPSAATALEMFSDGIRTLEKYYHIMTLAASRCMT